MLNRIAAGMVATAVLLLGGCYAPSSAAVANADYGRAMVATEMQELADDYLSRRLVDPDSRRVQWGRSGKAWLWQLDGHRYGYGMEALVNARNRFGGYAGNKLYYFHFRDGALTHAHEARNVAYGFVP